MALGPTIHQGRRSWHDPYPGTPACGLGHWRHLYSYLHSQRHFVTLYNRKKSHSTLSAGGPWTDHVTRFRRFL